MPEWFHSLNSSLSHLDLQKFKVKSGDCLGNSRGNVSCHSEEWRPLSLWQFLLVWLLNFKTCFGVCLFLIVEKSLVKSVIIKLINLIFDLSFFYLSPPSPCLAAVMDCTSGTSFISWLSGIYHYMHMCVFVCVWVCMNSRYQKWTCVSGNRGETV